MTIHKVLLAILLLATAKMFSQSIGEVKKEALSQILYQHANDDSPGLAVGVVKNSEIAYENYVGFANLEHKIKVAKDTRFNIASNAKQFTALCVLKLVEEGKIRLEDDIRKYLPDLYKNIEDSITISDLIAHTSGIRDVYELWALKGKTWWQLFIDNGDAMELLTSQTALNFKPGTEYLYSNSNYILLTEIIKKVTGEKFSDVTKSMFQELGMPNSGFLTNYMAVIPNKAQPYGNWNGWKEYPAITELHGDGALYTTLADQLKWEQIVQRNDGSYYSSKLIDQSQTLIANAYGYGLMFDSSADLDYTYHDGNTGAYNATFLRFPSEKMSVVVMSNNGSVPTNYLAWQITNLILEKDDAVYPGTPDIIEKLKRIENVLGNYQNEDGTIIKIMEKDGSLYRELYQRDPVKLIQEKEGLFQYETFQDLKMNFTNIGESKQQFTLYLSSQKPSTYYKIGDSDLRSFDKNALNGSFYNDETDTKVSIKFMNDTTYFVTKNGKERKAELILEDYLRMNSYEIKIIRDAQGNVVGLNVNNGRVQNVLFTKT
ncbi:serine hydrolase [Aureisphaera galaxeae]|uniref:serine hydrolase domain-containing protein n=1 Tax=Aureisphaera galaxeae TaxID=1538023 RepID=UPI002350E81A|nr:serine hydrolase domain-containing protein [Aureisphaera galaxeae]MDC8004206.1 serine hydrolase [Aureisphaera galaxeae]